MTIGPSDLPQSSHRIARGRPSPSDPQVRRNLLIDVGDGVTLAADLVLPTTRGPHPTLVSYYPYHKDGSVGAADRRAHRFFADRGYASLLVDMRGLGGSSGVAPEAGDPLEASDAVAIIEWTASQDWSDDNIGMWGLSYGGFTALAAAAARPAHLKAVIPMMPLCDLYRDFLFPGGCRSCLAGTGVWGAQMVAMQLMPPLHQDVDGRWLEVWRQRLATSRPWMLAWHEHRAHDDFWRSRELDLEAIEVPTFLIGGWRDIFPEATVSAYARLSGPRKLMMGPWLHTEPAASAVAPVDHLSEMCRWWDHWLRGRKTGITDEPPVSLYVQGRGWRWAEDWPPPEVTTRTLGLSGTALTVDPPAAHSWSDCADDPTVGLQGPLWEPSANPLALPHEQSPDDRRSLVFTSEPVEDPLEITGSPEAIVYLDLTGGDAVSLSARLCDVAPDDASSLITTGCLRVEPQVLGDDVAQRVVVPLWATSYLLDRGHRIRLSIARADFPRIWPTVAARRLRLHTGPSRPSRLRLPHAEPERADASERRTYPEAPPAAAAPRAPGAIDVYEPIRRLERDASGDRVSATCGKRRRFGLPGGQGHVAFHQTTTASLSAQAPGACLVTADVDVDIAMPDGSIVLVEARTIVTDDVMTIDGRIVMDGVEVFARRWSANG